MSKKKKIPLGLSDFKTIITENNYFVDKSLFIRDVEQSPQVLLFPRPRRFGKTLNLSMLKYFYDKTTEDNSVLFQGLKIAEDTEIMQKQGKHPVIYITFKDVKSMTWEGCYDKIARVLYSMMKSFSKVLASEVMSEIDILCCENILSNKAKAVDYEESLKVLSHALYHAYQAKPIILIDEYDTPIHVAYENNYYQEVIYFMRGFLGSALKDNEYLEKAVLTGILRVSKESMFSGLNNIRVCSICESIGADKYGFTESEVAEMLHHYDDIYNLAEIKHWYDGYNFSEVEIYNPWSILYSIDTKRLSAHWINTSGNDLIKELCLNAEPNVKQEIEILGQGGYIQKRISDNIVFNDIDKDDDALWSFMVHSGYLRYDHLSLNGNAVYKTADLSIPNREILGLFQEEIIKKWFTPPTKTKELTKLMNDLISGDVMVFKDSFIDYCQNALSYYDVGTAEPENVYHMFTLGMLFCLKDKYHVISNRESGLGRCDVMLVPRESSGFGRGVIFEFKRVNKDKRETFEDAIESAKEQIVERCYSQELQSRGCKEIVNIVVAFAGKDVRVEVY